MNKEQENTSENKPARDEHGRLLPGHTANPKGKPKGSFSLISMLKAELQKKPKGQKKSHAYLLIQRILKAAIADGDDAQIKNILQYVEGMPRQAIDMKHEGEISLSDLMMRKDG